MSEIDDLIKEKLDMMNRDRVDRELFLDDISQLESSGGKNFNHKPMESGIHEGQSAIGRFGLMPNTVKEIISRNIQQGVASDAIRGLEGQSPQELKQFLESNPEVEYELADQLAKKVLKKQKDPEKAAYTWFQGHNLSPQQVDQRDYQNSEYVKRFQNLRKRLNSK